MDLLSNRASTGGRKKVLGPVLGSFRPQSVARGISEVLSLDYEITLNLEKCTALMYCIDIPFMI